MVDVIAVEKEPLLKQSNTDEKGREDPLDTFSIGLQCAVKSARNPDQADNPQDQHGECGDEEQIGDAVFIAAKVAAQGEAVTRL